MQRLLALLFLVLLALPAVPAAAQEVVWADEPACERPPGADEVALLDLAAERGWDDTKPFFTWAEEAGAAIDRLYGLSAASGGSLRVYLDHLEQRAVVTVDPPFDAVPLMTEVTAAAGGEVAVLVRPSCRSLPVLEEGLARVNAAMVVPELTFSAALDVVTGGIRVEGWMSIEAACYLESEFADLGVAALVYPPDSGPAFWAECDGVDVAAFAAMLEAARADQVWVDGDVVWSNEPACERPPGADPFYLGEYVRAMGWDDQKDIPLDAWYAGARIEAKKRLSGMIDADPETYFGVYTDLLEQHFTVVVDPGVTDIAAVLDEVADQVRSDAPVLVRPACRPLSDVLDAIPEIMSEYGVIAVLAPESSGLLAYLFADDETACQAEREYAFAGAVTYVGVPQEFHRWAECDDLPSPTTTTISSTTTTTSTTTSTTSAPSVTTSTAAFDAGSVDAAAAGESGPDGGVSLPLVLAGGLIAAAGAGTLVWRRRTG